MKIKHFVASMAIGLTVLVGLSRSYLGFHWPINVWGGWSVGIILANFWCKLFNLYLPGNETEQLRLETA